MRRRVPYRYQRMLDRNRLILGLIALSYLSAMLRREGWSGALALAVPLAIPLSLIWYAGVTSASKGWGWAQGRINKPSPPFTVRAQGWVLLVIPAVIMAVQWLRAT